MEVLRSSSGSADIFNSDGDSFGKTRFQRAGGGGGEE